ncbi:PRC-barrel domain-containing protein [Ornithinimicrobium sp. W1665]|uniref:PRC-barrel domain-containing protein n=1 Tax=Ornithinimicrobium sp. W1665 TaxID=3416666 RepID=UPI003CF16C35
MDSSQETIAMLYDADVMTVDGDRLGDVGQVYLDDETGAPAWVSVRTGWFGARESLVPLVGAQVEGDTVRVAHTRQEIKDAPTVDADAHLDEVEQDRLFRHYGLVLGDGTVAPEASTAGPDGPRPVGLAGTGSGRSVGEEPVEEDHADGAELSPEQAVTGASENVAYPSGQDRPEGPRGGPTSGPGRPGRLRRHEGRPPRS